MGHLGAKGAYIKKHACFMLATSGTNVTGCATRGQGLMYMQPELVAAWGSLGSISAAQQYCTWIRACIMSLTEY